MSLHYYLYVSDSKVDMLLAQIDPAVNRKRTTEVNFNLSVVGGKHTTESPEGGDRSARLRQVVRYLEEQGELGTVDEPGRFFGGTLPLRWGPFPTDPNLVYFGGSTECTVVGLGGSAHHVLGATPESAPGLPRSLTPSLLAALATDPQIRLLVEAIGAQDAHPDRSAAPQAAQAVHRANAAMAGPPQRVEFVAKRLLHVPAPPGAGASVVLGTPLYVALVE
ncbi:DUF7019 family protein [Streptomyces sp. NPDC058239]|uniref:DUF7019 family protein n=1 Tax=unclassified Streptomyces TaxID=2593676 RepID=UPI00365E8C2F